MGSIRAGADGNVGAQFHFLEVLMLTQIFPQDSRRYLSLPLLGPLMDRYAGWLQEQRYTWRSTRYELRMAAHVSAYLRRRAVRRIEDVSAQHLAACHLLFRRKFPEEAGSVHVLARFLDENGLLKKSAVPPPVGCILSRVPSWRICGMSEATLRPRSSARAVLSPSS